MNTIKIILFVKDEEELIESFILYHVQIADKITIIDNGSRDNTLNIIEKYLRLHKDKINLIIYDDDFNNKGMICTKIMLESENDILIPLDADEFLLYDNSSLIVDNPKIIREYLQVIPINKHKYQVKKIYNKIENTNNYNIHIGLKKNIFPRLGFISVDCGFHFGEVENNDIKSQIDISYLHVHYLCKNLWLKNSYKKLLARLKNKHNDTQEILNLAFSHNKSYHVAQELVRYMMTGEWNVLENNITFETPHLTSLFQKCIIRL